MPLDLDEYSDTNLRNIEDLSSKSRAGVSNSATRPAYALNFIKLKLFKCDRHSDHLTYQQEKKHNHNLVHTLLIIYKISFLVYSLDTHFYQENKWNTENAPSLRTRTRSLSITVGIRCAMVQTVQSLNSVLIIFWMRLSVAESTEAVASSSTKILACLSKARPRDTSCRWPTLQFSPFSKTARHQFDEIFLWEFKRKPNKTMEEAPITLSISCFSPI